jgi:hypothetical protein
LAEGSGKIIPVELMGKKDALALLRIRVPFAESDQADAEDLVQELEGIPLAIAQAGAYIKMRSSITTLSTYLKDFREDEAGRVHLLGWDSWRDQQRDHSKRNPVIMTWQISFNHIQNVQPSATDLLSLMCMFDKQGIPNWLLRYAMAAMEWTGDVDQWGPADLLRGLLSEREFKDRLVPLIDFSLVITEIGDNKLSMHRLVQPVFSMGRL